MAKISAEAKEKYFDKLQGFKSSLEQIQTRINSIKATLDGQPGTGDSTKLLTTADEELNLVSYYIVMNELSLSLLGVKNEAYLNDARKGIYKAIILLEDVVSNYIDVPFSDYEEQLSFIEEVPTEQRFLLLKKLGYSIQAVEDGFGENTKWRWSFVELEGRYATILKNMLNMKTLIVDMDPRSDVYQLTLDHLKYVKEWLQIAADRYRQKYELSTLRIDDFKLAINYLSALRRIHIVLAESAEAEELKKKIEIWKSKMESDSKKSEAQKKAR
jgi:hypothetical protein